MPRVSALVVGGLSVDGAVADPSPRASKVTPFSAPALPVDEDPPPQADKASTNMTMGRATLFLIAGCKASLLSSLNVVG